MVPFLYIDIPSRNKDKIVQGMNIDGSNGAETRAMFVGGDVGAHDHELLFKNGITARLCCKGKFSCPKEKRLYDMEPLLIEEVIGDSR